MIIFSSLLLCLSHLKGGCLHGKGVSASTTTTTTTISHYQGSVYRKKGKERKGALIEKQSKKGVWVINLSFVHGFYFIWSFGGILLGNKHEIPFFMIDEMEDKDKNEYTWKSWSFLYLTHI